MAEPNKESGMTSTDKIDADLKLSHLELYVDDIVQTERFYTRLLGFVVTDRDPDGDMVFLSGDPAEHHQLVLNAAHDQGDTRGELDHISFRVESLGKLRDFDRVLRAHGVVPETVSHGNSWSIYFRDPAGNRLEIFTATPWHVSQPCRFEIDLQLGDEELLELTERRIRDLPGFSSSEAWRRRHLRIMQSEIAG